MKELNAGEPENSKVFLALRANKLLHQRSRLKKSTFVVCLGKTIWAKLQNSCWLVSLVKNKPQQEGIPTKPGYKKLFILILQKTSNNN